MSDQLQLSESLIQDLLQTIRKYDEKSSDEWVACQYLAATFAYLAARQNTPNEQKEEILNEIMSFVRYVYNDTIQEQQTGAAVGNPDQAFGIWHPDS